MEQLANFSDEVTEGAMKVLTSDHHYKDEIPCQQFRVRLLTMSD